MLAKTSICTTKARTAMYPTSVSRSQQSFLVYKQHQDHLYHRRPFVQYDKWDFSALAVAHAACASIPHITIFTLLDRDISKEPKKLHR